MEFVRKNKGAAMKVVEREGVPFLVFPGLDETEAVIHGFSTRMGGVSEGMFSSMNLSFARGDEEGRVRENFARLGRAMGLDCRNLVFSDQTHTSNVRVVTEADRGKGFVREKDYRDVDGLVTNVPGLVLATFYADCVPLFLVDPVHRAVGLSHSGWKGTVGKIGKRTVELMKEQYGTRPEDLTAAIGPSICQDCYEVSEDVIGQFQEAFEKTYWKEIFYEKPDGKYQLNLWRANELIFREAGLLPERILTTDLCTCCNAKLLFSHRASKGKRGNLGAFLMLKE
ncbi:MAG: peptidoglycan editing factor PgeF [Lachnospiraceae bacterium]|nr:peptidoglycan editing factor PgeF [Lachnospiraceae bacterium]MCI9384134.1 peptidoglycan editing factor PgeF [Lachnospiraceae bacterium]MCI9623529.1 peptidoglycan editing factor PgeF [Lachnospiraceae bacterium]